MENPTLARVRAALGRTSTPAAIAAPPAIDESIVRRVNGGDLAELFCRMCEENKMHVDRASAEDLPRRLCDFVRAQNAKRIATSAGGAVERLGIASVLRQNGFDAKSWDEITLDDVYDFDCGITDVDWAIAETGSLAIRAAHGRALSLVPPLHVALVERAKIVPDLIDLFTRLNQEGSGSAVSLITGPSKTSDIEMNLVIGVHGPVTVQVFLI